MRQYIGARYVPQFFDDGNGSTEWAGPTIVYDALTVVTHLGNSFTSKKPVPVGIDISNTDYWASTGIWNAQVQAYKQEVDQLKADFDDYVARNASRNIIFIGDSFGVATNADGKTMFDLAGEYLGADHVYINSISSKGFTTSPSFLDMLQSVVIDIEPEDITDIIVVGGPNDFSSDGPTIKAAISTFITTAKTAYPNAKIYIGEEGAAQNVSTRSGLRRVVLPAYKDCIFYGATYLDNLEYVLIPPYQSGDGLHPTQAGVDVLGRAIAEAYLNGECCPNYFFEINSGDITINTAAVNSISFGGVNSIALGLYKDTAFYGANALGMITINMGGLGWANGTEKGIGTITLDKMPFISYMGSSPFQGEYTVGGYYHSVDEDVLGSVKVRINQNGIGITPNFPGHNLAQASGSISFAMPNISFPAVYA